MTNRLALFMVLMGFSSGLGQLSTNIYLPSFPSISKDLASTLQAVQLSLTAFLLSFALSQVISGRLIAFTGARRLLAAGMLVLGISSLAVPALSISTITELYAVRCLQAFGAGMVVVSSRVRITELLHGQLRDKAFGISNLGFVIAPAVAPIAGAFIEDNFGWRYGFAVVGLVSWSLIAFYLLIDQYKSQEVEENLNDSPGGIRELADGFSFVISSSLMYGAIFALFTRLPTELGCTTREVGLFMSVAVVLIALGNLSVGFLTARLSRHLVYSSALYVAVYVVILALFNYQSFLTWELKYALTFPLLLSIGVLMPLSVSAYMSSGSSPGARASVIGSAHLVGGAIGASLASLSYRYESDVLIIVAALTVVGWVTFLLFDTSESTVEVP